MASAGAPPQSLPAFLPHASNPHYPQPPGGDTMTRAAGKALFSTKLGQFALRPVLDPPDPVIARAPNSINRAISQQIDRFAEQLCEEFPDQCRNIYLGFYTIHDYFDPSDIARLGEKYLNGVLERIAAPNSEAVANFTYQWSANNREAVEKMCYPFDLGDFFSEDELRERGVLFFIHAVNLIRRSLERTGRRQQARAEVGRVKEASGPDTMLNESTKNQQGISGPGKPRFERPQVAKMPMGLYRVGIRQPQIALPQQASSASTVTVPAGPRTETNNRFRKGSQASTSNPATPTLSQREAHNTSTYQAKGSPRLPKKLNSSKNVPRIQPYNPVGSANVPTPQRINSMPRMSAMAPGFTPQIPPGHPGPSSSLHGPPSQAVTPQDPPAQLYSPSMPFMHGSIQGGPHVLDPSSMSRDLNQLQVYPGFPGVYSSYPDMPSNQTQLCPSPQTTPRITAAQVGGAPVSAAGYMPVPTYTSTHMTQPGLANMTNVQHGGSMQNMRQQRRVSGPRQDFHSRPPHKPFGKPSRGGRRNSIRGNYNGANFAAPSAGQPSFRGSPHFQHSLPMPMPNMEPFPPFMPLSEDPRRSSFQSKPTENREEMCSVWVHNIKDMGTPRTSEELKNHFESLLNKPVLDVTINCDKNQRLYAYVEFSNNHDANEALSLHHSEFQGQLLIVKVPLKYLTDEERQLEETLKNKNHIPAQMHMARDKTAGSQPYVPPQLGLQYGQFPASQQMLPYATHESNSMASAVNNRQSSTSERHASTTASIQRSRGPSRTYEAKANDPMSYSPQDVRRIQPIEGASTTAANVPQTAAPHEILLHTADAPVQDFEQRPESRGSSTASSTKRKKRRGPGGRDKSTSGTSTPEPSTSSSVDRTTTSGKQTPDSLDVTGQGGNDGMVDKTITTIPESHEQDQPDERVSPDKESSAKLALAKAANGKKKNKKSKKGVKTEKTAEEKGSELEVSCKPLQTDSTLSTKLKQEGAQGYAASSKQQSDNAEGPQNEPLMAADVQSQPEKAEKPALKLSRAQVPVPDISIHSRKEKSSAASTVSSTGRFSYAQAAASAKSSIPMPSAPAAAKSPASEHSEMRDLKSRYFTPMDSPTSPSSKSEKTVAPGTPVIVTTRKTEETPEKDDSFVTVQEEPSSAKKGFEKHESLVVRSDVQTAEAVESILESPDTPTGPGSLEEQAAAREAMATPAPAGKSNWADGSATPEEFSTPLENKSEMDKVAEKTDKVKVEDSAVTDPLERSMPHDTGSIHPMARPKGDKKKQPKKVKSYGKGKKGASVSK